MVMCSTQHDMTSSKAFVIIQIRKSRSTQMFRLIAHFNNTGKEFSNANIYLNKKIELFLGRSYANVSTFVVKKTFH